jgi:hypothetical protein
MVTQSLQRQLNCQGPEGETKYNHEIGREYVRTTKTPYRNLMLNKQILIT